MGAVMLEVAGPDGGWTRIGTVGPGDPAGTFTSEGPDGRDLYVFGWRDGAPGLWRSTAGADVATGAARAYVTAGLALVSDLAVPCEVTVWRPVLPVPALVRVSLAEETPQPVDGAAAVAEHLAECSPASAVVVMQDGSADEMVAGLLADGWVLEDRVDRVAGKRIRYVRPPATGSDGAP